MHEALARTPLYDKHKEAGAKIVDFSGWEMPVEYEGIIAEHNFVRNHAGIFDVSHMGQISITGDDAENFLLYLLPNDVSVLEDGGMLYSVMCNEDGGIIDDLIVARLAPQCFFMVVNCATMEKDFEWIILKSKDFPNCKVENYSDKFGMIAIQGPESEKILQKLTDYSLETLKYFHTNYMNILGKPMMVSRTGYTGEDGFEVLCQPEETELLWDSLLEQGAKPIGLGARDTLRLEMGYSLYGNDIDLTTNPLEAGLGWTVKLKSNREFIGSKVLQEVKTRGISRKLVGLVLKERGVPRHDQKIYDGEEQVGEITSGTFSPSRKDGIALGYVKADLGKAGTSLFIEIRNRKLPVEVVKLPFVKAGTKSGS